MKKILSGLILVCVLMSTCSLPQNLVQAATNRSEISIYIDGQKITLDTKPIIVKDRALVPLRGVFEKLGATVDWNKETKQVIVKNKAIEVLLEADNQAVLVNGEVAFLDSASQLISGRTLVPVRFVAESLGHTVGWNAATRRIDIHTKTTITTVKADLPKLGSAAAFTQLLHYNHVLDAYINRRLIGFDGGTIAVDGKDSIGSVASPTVSESSEATTAPSSKPSNDSKSSDDFSGTNNQTEGVDEGDIIKTNGQNIFSLNQNRIYILDTNPVKPQILSTIEIPDVRGNVSDLYVEGNHLVLIGSSWVQYGYPKDLVTPFGPDFRPSYSTSNTFVLVYDIKDVTKPVVVKDMDFEGSYVSSRLIGEQLYMITNKGINYWSVEPMYKMAIDSSVKMMSPSIIAYNGGPSNPLGLSDDAYKKQLEALYEYQFKPKYANNLTGQTTFVDYKDISYFPDYVTPNFMLTVGMNLSSDAVDVKTYLGSAETVYASADNLYLSFTKYEYASQYNTLIYVPNYNKTTTIYKFKCENGLVNYEARGSVPGSILNQFSLDEFEGNLRIATTTGEMWDTTNPSKNNVFILNSNLENIGKLEGLAPGERIYSTRFAGNRIYMVTFRQVDPLFVIDASVPTAPKLLGDLKVPGFSTYMHILDENHILGFGSDTVEKDGRVTTGGFKISLFDVTDPTAPIEKSHEVIGVAGTYSELQYNHKALMISLSKGIMAFPISVSGSTPYVNDFSGAYVYNISNNAFSYKGNVTHQSQSTLTTEGDYKYYDYNFNINRLIYIGDYLYSVSAGKLEVTNLLNMTKSGEVTFPVKVYGTQGVQPIDIMPVPQLTK
ncbi:MAG: beta-propeller domain-containing protein [Vallitaleaceae bacterium]|nr:beta-propeller domain-containing protein [Vallitaleaceae bacterium]